MLTTKGFYKKDHEDSPQQTLARASTCYSFGDYEFAQRIYNYASKGWFTFASPVLSNAVDIDWPTFTRSGFELAGDWLEEHVTPDGLPISCFLSKIGDNRRSLVEGRKETAWLSMLGGGIGICMKNRSPDEKSTGIMAHLRGYDADAISYKQTSCYTPDMEILTNRGWVRFDSTLEDDVVMTVDAKGQPSFEKPSEWLEYDYVGDIHTFGMARKGLNLKVTPNHNMVVSRKRTTGWSDLEKVEAKDLKFHSEIKLFTTSGATHGDPVALTPKERLMLAHQADGHNHVQGYIAYHFSKKRKVERLSEILSDCGIEFSSSWSDVTNTCRFYVKHDHLPKNLDWINLAETSPEKAEAYIEEIAHWDGYTDLDGRISFTSTCKEDVEKVQALALISGFGTCVAETAPREGSNHNTIYTLTMKVRGHFLAEKMSHSVEDYEGKVYCCTVKSGNLVVRAGRCPLVCGNSRRGSIAAYLDIDHPEIKNFISMRNPVGGDKNRKCFNLNNAVSITDDFMRKVIAGEKYELVDPQHGPTGTFLDAREVLEEINDQRFETGEPYIMFKDTVNRNIPKWITKPTYFVEQSNLCS